MRPQSPDSAINASSEHRITVGLDETMDVAIVRNRLRETMERARRNAAERRAATDRAGADFAAFLSGIAAPLVRQIANVLKAESYSFTVFTPSGNVRLMSDKSAEDFIEITLNTAGDTPRVVAHISSHGRRVIDEQRVVGSGDPATISEDELLAFLLKALEPFVER